MSDDPRQSPTSDAAAADLLGPKTVLEIQRQGRAAAVSGEHVNTCPWAEPADDVDQARRDMWIRGYAMGRTDLRHARDQR